MQDTRIAAVNFQSEFGKIETNLSKIEEWATTLARQNVDIICFPELSLCGYDNSPALLHFSFPIPSSETEELAKIAKKTGTTLLVGFNEIDAQKKCYISHLVVSPEGISGVYRKTHLGPTEQNFFTPGDTIPVFQHPKCCFGIQICFESHFPEISMTQALQGAEILFIPFASPPDTPANLRERFLRYLPARAYDNSCYVVNCNPTGQGKHGKPFSGVALIINPKGLVIAEQTGWEEQAVIATLTSEELSRIKQTKMGYFLDHRRPEIF